MASPGSSTTARRWCSSTSGTATWNARAPFVPIRDHVLLPRADALAEADAQLAPLLTPERIAAIVALIPDAWLDAPRDAYRAYFDARLQAPRAFAEEARHAHARL